MFGAYLGHVQISDGINKDYMNVPGEICFNPSNGLGNTVFMTDGLKITGFKVMKGRRVIEWQVFGKFLRRYVGDNGQRLKHPIVLPYHHKSKRAIHGIVRRHDQRLFGASGVCRTKYSRGKMLWQEFRYANGRLAYRVRHNSKELHVKYRNGTKAVEIQSPKGICPNSGEYGNFSGGSIYFCWESVRTVINETRMCSRDGNCSLIINDHHGRLLHKGEYRNRQKYGEWIVDQKPVVFINGVQVSKKLWDTKPEDLKISRILREPNAQIRAALLAKIGPERIYKQSKYRTIHKTRDGMRLMEFPISVDTENIKGRSSRLRILQVRCPSTKGMYYLQVPDFVWDNGKKTKLDTCEQARQWTFGVDNPKQKIKFAKET